MNLSGFMHQSFETPGPPPLGDDRGIAGTFTSCSPNIGSPVVGGYAKSHGLCLPDRVVRRTVMTWSGVMEMMCVHTNGSTTNVLALPQGPFLQGSGFFLVSDGSLLAVQTGKFLSLVSVCHWHCFCHVLQIARRSEQTSDANDARYSVVNWVVFFYSRDFYIFSQNILAITVGWQVFFVRLNNLEYSA